ncbi:MAG TPA: HAD family hydrolase [Pseudonocardiaceae bacterium]|nr:HAD family hydrolase [Pseudonocardiaceae bacterium]
MNTRAVVFDYFGTLNPTIVMMVTDAERRAVGVALGVDPDELEAQWRATFVARSTGRTGDLTATLRTLATRAGGAPTDAGLAEAARIRAAAYRRSAQPRPDTVAVLEALRDKGLRLAVVSDCAMELVTIWPALPVADRVDATVFSALVGRRKPDPLMYRLACERLNVPPEDCLYVGDGGSGELTGAATAGMRPVLLADADWSTGHRYDQDTWHGKAIHELNDVLGLV